jgi:hypothetical protein
MASFPPQQVSQPGGMPLLLPDQLMLAAFSPGNGRLRSRDRPYLTFGLAGAALTELALRGAVAVAPGRGPARKFQVRALPTAAGDPFLDAMAASVRAERPRTLGWWITKGLAGVHRQVLARLAAGSLVTTRRGVVRQHNYLAWPQGRAEVTDRLVRVLVADPASVARLWAADPRSVGLASLAAGCGVFDIRWLPRDQRRLAGANLRAIRGSDPIGQAVADEVMRAKNDQQAAAIMPTTVFVPPPT